jgi:hypothetical protein
VSVPSTGVNEVGEGNVVTMRRPVESSGAEKVAFPAWAGPAERLRFLLRYAILAPSRHNTQPWLFEIEGPELRVYGDARRALKVADPQGRELVMACGAALYNVAVAARRFGHGTSVEIARAGRRDGLLARLTLEERRSPTPEDEALFLAIAQRRTNRFGFDAREVPFGLIMELVREVAAAGAVLRVVERAARPEVAQLVAQGDKAQWASARFRAELATWSRSNDGAHRDGMPGYAHGLSESASLFHRMMVRLRHRGDDASRDRTFTLHSRALLALCTREDDAPSWLVAGQAMQRVLLRATAAGLAASYFSQAVEVAPVRARLRTALGERAWPQLLFRLGHGVPVRATPRRPVDLVLRSMTTSAPAHAITRSAGDAAAST